MKRTSRWLFGSVALLVVATALFAAWVMWSNRSTIEIRDQAPFDQSASAVERGAYLARAGNCMHCHTAPGGTPWAGGRELATPFGSLFSPNITPHATQGIGRWNADQFWRALHEGRSADGRLLYPAFPYTSYTRVSRADSDALFAYLNTLPASDQPNQPHTLRWPYNQQAALAVWRALFFRPQPETSLAADATEQQRGAYLVQGLGHCADCHAPRNAWGASRQVALMPGGMMPMRNWYAPSLSDPAEAGVQDWPIEEIVELLATGQAPRGTVAGPMREVVQHSTQHLSRADLTAIASYLKALPVEQRPATNAPARTSPAPSTRGAAVYRAHCAQCHGDQGEGQPGAYPPLAGNRAVLMNEVTNLVEQTLHGGFGPSTAANPRPYGMPPYAQLLNDDDVAAVLTHIRSSWGNTAPAVSTLEVKRVRAAAVAR